MDAKRLVIIVSEEKIVSNYFDRTIKKFYGQDKIDAMAVKSLPEFQNIFPERSTEASLVIFCDNFGPGKSDEITTDILSLLALVVTERSEKKFRGKVMVVTMDDTLHREFKQCGVDFAKNSCDFYKYAEKKEIPIE